MKKVNFETIMRRRRRVFPTCLVTVSLVYLVIGSQGSPIEGTVNSHPGLGAPFVAIGRCRVECLKKFPQERVKGKSKPDNKNILREKDERHHVSTSLVLLCWKFCENIFRSFDVFSPICNGRDVCQEGCQTACEFRTSNHRAPNITVTWKFVEKVRTDTDFLQIDMKWEPPVPSVHVMEPHPIVYTLLMRENNDDWELIDQTSKTKYAMYTQKVPFVPEFLIQAIDETGVVAESIFHVTKMIFADEIMLPDTKSSLRAGSNVVLLNYTMERSPDVNSGLTVKLTWDHPKDLEPANKETLYYKVTYILKKSGVYEDMPGCNHPSDQYTSSVPVLVSEKPQYTIRNLLYNSEYIVLIVLNSRDLAMTSVWTTPCRDPSENCKECYDETERSSMETPELAPEESDESLSELIRNVTVTLLSQNNQPDTVLVNISWTFLSDSSKVNFSIAIMQEDDSGGLLVYRDDVPGTYVVVQLLDSTVYKVVIGVYVTNEKNEREFFDESQRRISFNTSELQFAIKELPYDQMTKKHLKAVNSVIIGACCAGVLVIGAFVVLILYKKRQSFKGIIIPKTTVAKSNSYKSSVGGKADYSNQLMVFGDEWELDPRELKFSTPLGQGAFGKVVTGYYCDRKVAIKLVKEGAPMSYKEDLVAEINLMKRLGTHPNIVCLIGACTMAEPIALIMEYVPNGNLQNFLKKCRLEGDLQKRPNGPSEIQYSMLQDCGGIENGVITPTDMLSFARQVAMAMEYLAEKKYVHRDLAARNVLLHYNKVVKVCDFGLSRDIFNDNQYKKLTNGKLPLKWMAIESLRDRVFTTQSDVWSFGILLWEIVTMGASPYPNIALADLYYVLSNNYRMDKPSNCSNELYAMMRSCWMEEPLDRPSFTELREQLEELMSEDRDYLVLEDIDVPLSASESSSNPTVPELFSGELCPSPSAVKTVSASSSGSGSSASAAASAAPPSFLRQGPPIRRLPMTIDVCIHQKSTERLMRPSESDSSP